MGLLLRETPENTVYTYDSYKHLPVKIVKIGEKKWKVFRLKTAALVEVVFDNPLQVSDIKVKFEWEEKAQKDVWNTKLQKYCDYYTYQPYNEKDEDIYKQVNIAMLEYTKTWHNYLVRWEMSRHIDEMAPEKGFSLRNFSRKIAPPPDALVGYVSLGLKGEKPVEAIVNGRRFATNSLHQAFEFREGKWQNIGSCTSPLAKFAENYCKYYPFL
jgi:hypothetical protein